MENKIIEMTIDELDDETRVEKISFVDDPAIKREWLAFQKHGQAFKIQSEEKRIVSGALMVADLPIFRRSKTGEEYYVVFNAETIKKIVFKFVLGVFGVLVNEMHEKDVDGVFMFESILIDEERGIGTPSGHDTLPNGSWFGSFKVDNDAVWAKVKDGTFRGFSVEGIFDEAIERDIDSRIISALREILEAN